MRKKISYATLLSVVDANTSSEEGSEAKEEQKDAANTSSIENLPIVCCKQNNPMPCPSYYIVHDPYPNSCSILWKYIALYVINILSKVFFNKLFF